MKKYIVKTGKGVVSGTAMEIAYKLVELQPKWINEEDLPLETAALLEEGEDGEIRFRSRG